MAENITNLEDKFNPDQVNEAENSTSDDQKAEVIQAPKKEEKIKELYRLIKQLNWRGTINLPNINKEDLNLDLHKQELTITPKTPIESKEELERMEEEINKKIRLKQVDTVTIEAEVEGMALADEVVSFLKRKGKHLSVDLPNRIEDKVRTSKSSDNSIDIEITGEFGFQKNSLRKKRLEEKLKDQINRINFKYDVNDVVLLDEK